MPSDHRASWQAVSPHLDTALELPRAERASWLAGIRERTPELADQIAHWLAQCEALEGDDFLEGAATIEPARSALAGLLLGAYRLIEPIGHGGMGSVWLAERSDGRYEGRVAVKLLSAALVGRGGEERFAREGRFLAKLAHPQIAHLIDAGVSPIGQPYLVLEYVEGQSIVAHCDAARLDVTARVRLFLDVLAPVAHAHAHLVVHRDLKPSNVMVTLDGQVKLLDFGIARLLESEFPQQPVARLTLDGDSLLTPAYAAPEQVNRGDVSTATDVYALGVLLHVLLTGRHPAERVLDNPAELLRAIVHDDPPRMSDTVAAAARESGATLASADARGTTPTRLQRSLQGDLDVIVATALRKAPADRYGSVAALADDLRRHLAQQPIAARAATTPYRVSRFVARHRRAVVAATLAVVAILAGLVGTITQARRAELEGARARQEAASARDERDRAIAAQRIQRGTNEFLQLVMRDAARDDPGALRRQLDRTSELLDKTEFESPLVKIGLLRQTAARYGELAAWREGLALMRRAQALANGPELAGPTSAIPVNLACSTARYAYEMGDVRGAMAELARADRLLVQGADVGIPSRVECRLYRAYVELALGQFVGALTTTTDAMQALEASGIRTGEQHRIMRSALARTLMSVGRTADALAIARPLLAESEAGQGRQSMAVIRRSVLTTMVLRTGGQPDEAWILAQLDGAAVARILGPGRRDLQTDLELGRVLTAVGRPAEAAAFLERAVQAGRAAGPALLLASAELAAAEALIAANQPGRAEALLSTSAAAVATALADRPEMIEALRVRALLARARGARAAARHLLDQAQAQADANGGDAHPSTLEVSSVRAAMALEDRQPAVALAACQRALTAARLWAIDKERSSDVGRVLSLRARIHAALGQGDQSAADRREACKVSPRTCGQ